MIYKVIYKELTPVEALKRLAEAGKPIEGLAFFSGAEGGWGSGGKLTGVDLNPDADNRVFFTDENFYARCAELVKEAAQPWGFDDVPSQTTWMRRRGGGGSHFLIYAVRPDGIEISRFCFIEYARLSEWEHSADRKNWMPCEK